MGDGCHHKEEVFNVKPSVATSGIGTNLCITYVSNTFGNSSTSL